MANVGTKSYSQDMYFQFSCQPGCTKCCDVRGFVYITEENLRNMAAYKGMTAADFEARYVLRFKKLLRLRKPKKSQCHFLQEGGCSVHPVKPVQCRLYPFWPELVEDRDVWEAERKACPGIGKGELVQIGVACKTASEMRIAYPHMYQLR